MTAERLSVVILHHKDDAEVNEKLRKHLSPLESVGRITVWAESDIMAGEDFEYRTREAIEGAHCVLCLLSASLHADTAYWTNCVEFAYQKSQKGNLKLIPMLVRAFDWKETIFKKKKILPKNEMSILDSKWSDSDEPYQQIAAEISIWANQIKPPQTSPNQQQQGYVIPLEFQEIEQVFETKKDNEAMSHISFANRGPQFVAADHFAAYKEMLREIRERMGEARPTDFYFGNIEDAALVEQIGLRIQERSNLLKIDLLGLGKLSRNLIQTSRDFRLDFALPAHNELRNRGKAQSQIVKPFCDEILKFEQKLNNLSAHRRIDVDVSDINPN